MRSFFSKKHNILSLLQNAGGIVVAIICDGNRINQSFFKLFNVKPNSPWRTKDDIFLLFDYVHLLKSIRNNWITEKTQELLYTKSGKQGIAKWSDLKNLHNFEKENLIKLFRLSDTSVCPKPIERQKVSTCLQVFCDRTVSALRTHPLLNNLDVSDTADFINIFVQFWKIVNVHGSFEDVRLNDERRSVITSPLDSHLQFLHDLGDLAKSMSPALISIRVKSLTRDTSSNLSHTCYGLIDLATFLLHTAQHDYVILGNFTTDPLEKEFSKLRQGSGGAYFISVQQALNIVEIRKTKLAFDLKSDIFYTKDKSSSHNCSKCSFLLNVDLCEVIDKFPKIEADLSSDIKMGLVYVSGYVSRYDDDFYDAHFLYLKYGSFLDDLNRGKLKILGDCVCQWSFFCYIMFHELAQVTCVESLCRVFQIISDLFSFGITYKQCRILSNVFFFNYVGLFSPRSEKEPRQKILKLSC